MQIGCHGLVWTGSFDDAGVRLSVEKTREAGFDLVEFPLMDPFAFNAEAATDALKEYGLAASASLGLSDATDISSEDLEAVRAGSLLLNQALAVTAAMGADHLCGVLYSAMRKYMTPSTARGRANSLSVIRDLGQRAEELGVQVSLEIVNRYETNLFNTGRDGLAYISQLQPSPVSLHLDTYHMNIEESGMSSAVMELGSALRYVHIGESHRGYLGTGNVDFDTFFDALASVDYDGPIVFESFSSAVVADDLSRMLGIWRNLWSDSDDLGAHANRYIRGQLSRTLAAVN